MQALASYILAAFDGKSLSNETDLKYFLVGSFSSAFVLFGMPLILYTTGFKTYFIFMRYVFYQDLGYLIYN